MLRIEDVETLCCPCGGRKLDYRGGLIGERIWNGSLTCGRGCNWSVKKGIPKLYEPHKVGTSDRVFKLIYDLFGPFHDASVRYLLPVLQLSSERTLREGYMPYLELGRSGAERPFRILEVGIGAGANIPLLDKYLPKDANAEIWGLDLSLGMMREAIHKVSRGGGGRRVRFVLGDAHHLPFPDHTFDRVFHIGAVNTFADPKRALAEMGRVARPHTPIVVVDEAFDEKYAWNLYLRAGFRFITIYDPNPHIPLECLPAKSYDVVSGQVNAFFYYMCWRQR